MLVNFEALRKLNPASVYVAKVCEAAEKACCSLQVIFKAGSLLAVSVAPPPSSETCEKCALSDELRLLRLEVHALRHKVDVYHEILAPSAAPPQPCVPAPQPKNRFKAYNLSISAYVFKWYTDAPWTLAPPRLTEEKLTTAEMKLRKSEQTMLSDMRLRLAIVMHMAQIDIRVPSRPSTTDRVACSKWKSCIQELGERIETAFNINMHELDKRGPTNKIQSARKRYNELGPAHTTPKLYEMLKATDERLRTKKLQDNETPIPYNVLPKLVMDGLASYDPEM